MNARLSPQKFRTAMLTLGIMVALAPQAWSQPGGGYFLQRLHNDLQLSPSQDGAWNAFEQSYQMDAQDMARQRDASARMAGLTGPQRMDLAIGMAEDNLAGMRRRGDALKAFYGTLSPDQQKIFDRDTLPPGGE
ncbi:MAG TPA: Spy/CpxP family protein refolding chaperone [Rhizomicrobium sp.]|nr:Spy/CpxP family protein refolding chaperone [Rhizomicrobium sp.]